eukprot:gene18649-biopygen15718
MPKEQLDDTAWLRDRSPLPLIADENCQRLADVKKCAGAFHGVNIKLMKCTGLREAHKMILLARALGLKVMLGCMTDTSCAISAAGKSPPPNPRPSAPARFHAAISPQPIPPVGSSRSAGNADFNCATNAGPRLTAGNTFTIVAPSASASAISIGV